MSVICPGLSHCPVSDQCLDLVRIRAYAIEAHAQLRVREGARVVHRKKVAPYVGKLAVDEPRLCPAARLEARVDLVRVMARATATARARARARATGPVGLGQRE